jgi:hypothetical protein
MRSTLALISAVLVCAGCTSTALERQTLSQEMSPTDIRFQEVVDNLAMVAHDPNTLPSYSSIYAGTAQITDTFQLAGSGTGGPAGAGALLINPQLTRATLGNWTLDPVNAPEKLEAIRCACQWVIYGSEFACHRCQGLLASPEEALDLGRHFGVADRLAKLPAGWVHVGHLPQVHPKARYKAHSHGTWVWIMPEDVQWLADFNLILQDIARIDSNSPTLFYPRPTPSSFSFPTKAMEKSACPTNPFGTPTPPPPPKVTATVMVDPCGQLAPDTPYYPWRQENLGSDSNLRSQINAAGLR